MSSTISIVTMSKDDLPFCFEQARREGWNPGPHDMDAFYATDPHGWFKSVDEAGRTTGCISAVAYDAHFGFVGFYVVLPEHRGGRVGIELGRRALEYLGDRVTGQDGVFAKVANYETWGFKLAYRNVRYAWRSGKQPADGGAAVNMFSPGQLPELLDFETGLFPCRRETFLARWLTLPGARTLVARENGLVTGYGMRRPCVSGYKIGPLFARDLPVAQTLLRAMLEDVPPDAPVYLDVPEVNAPAVKLVESLGMQPCFGTARMYRNGAPSLDTARIFGVTSFELG